MAYFHPAWLEHQRKRFTRADAYRFAPPGTPEAKMPGWLDPSATRVRLKEAQEEEARAHAQAAQEEFEHELAQLRASHERVKQELAEINYELAWRKFLRKYSPNQPRVPAGNPDGGRWTSGANSVGDAVAAGSGDDNLATGGDAGDRELAASSDTSSDVETTLFGADNPGWHDYRRGPTLACSAELRCSREEMADQLARFSLPGRDPSMPVTDQGTYPVHIPGTDIHVGNVRTRITEGGLTIENRTEEGHIFFDGVVVRRLRQSNDGAWYVTTHGFGNNVVPGTNVVNQLVGPEVFDELDRQMRANIERHHAKGALLDLAVHRVAGGRRHGSGPAVVGARHEIA